MRGPRRLGHVIDHRAVANTLIRLADDGALDSLFVEHGVQVAVLFGSAARVTEAPPNDLDIAVITDDGGALLQLLDGLSDALPDAVLDMVDLQTASIVLRSEALAGIPLFERVPGAFIDAQTKAHAERLSTGWLRRLDLELMAAP